MNMPATIVMVLLLAGFSSEFVQARERVLFQPPTGPRTSWRGRVVIRHGLFHDTYRERWGNGLTPQGAVVLNNAVTTIGPLIPSMISGGVLPAPQAGPAAADGGAVEDSAGFSSEAGAASFQPLDRSRTRANILESQKTLNAIIAQLASDELKPVELLRVDVEDVEKGEENLEDAAGAEDGIDTLGD